MVLHVKEIISDLRKNTLPRKHRVSRHLQVQFKRNSRTLVGQSFLQTYSFCVVPKTSSVP